MSEEQQPGPGQTIQPGQSVQPSEQQDPTPSEPPVSAPVPPADEPAPEPPQTTDDQNLFAQPEQTGGTSDESVSWEATEYIHHEKTPMWYAGFLAVVVCVVGLTFLITRDILTIVVSVVMAAAVMVYASRRPRTLRYSLSENGLRVGERQYTFDQFRSFSVFDDGGVPSITLDPTQRFMPALSLYFDNKDGDAILDLLEDFVPREDRPPDALDRFVRKIRF